MQSNKTLIHINTQQLPVMSHLCLSAGVVREGGGHLPVDQLPVRLPVCDRVRRGELLHHAGGDEEDEEGEGQHRGRRGLLQRNEKTRKSSLCLPLVAKSMNCF